MPTIEVQKQNTGVSIALVFDYDEFPRGNRIAWEQPIEDALEFAGIEYEFVNLFDNPDHSTTVVVIQCTKRAIMSPRLDDVSTIASQISGYVNMWVTTDSPLEHPEIKRQVKILEDM